MKILDEIGFDNGIDNSSAEEILKIRRLYRVKTVFAVGASYAIDSLFLILFSLAGTMPSYIALFYVCIGILHVVLFSILHWSGFSDRFSNPDLTFWQMCFALINQSLGMVLAPNVSIFFMSSIFINFAFGALRLNLKNAIFAWLIACSTLGIVLLNFQDDSLSPINPNGFELLIIWASFSSILLRCQLVGYYAFRLRDTLLSKNVNLSERMQYVEDMAVHDALTNVLNRRAILPLIEENIGLTKRKKIPCSIAIIDIDHFKSINDNHGHLVGDEVLKGLVGTIKAKIRTSDKLARYGGEEFILLMPATSLQEAYQVVERMRKDVELKSWNLLGIELKVTFSAGLASVEVEDDLVKLLSKADAALYQAKNHGRNCVVLALQ
jgi:diguanylate cyclase